MLYWIMIVWADGSEPTFIADTRWEYICKTAKENPRALSRGKYELWRMTRDGGQKKVAAIEIP